MLKFMGVQLEKDRTGMACLEWLPVLSKKNMAAPEQTIRLLEQCPLDRRDQSGDVWP